MYFAWGVWLLQSHIPVPVSVPVPTIPGFPASHKKDKVLALAYIAAERDASVTYRDSSEECRRRAAVKRRQRARVNSDIQSVHGPPDKSSNFSIAAQCDSDDIEHVFSPPKKKAKQQFKGIDQRVEVRYNDGIILWYKGTLVDFDVTCRQWRVEFDADDETTTVTFPDKDVRLC